jgi:hypothetical protein
VKGVAALLVVASACGRSDSPERAASGRTDVPDRPDYAPRTKSTSIKVDEVFVSDRERPFSHDRYITVLGDGTVRYANTEKEPETHTGHASRQDVAHVLNELANIDFLNLQCRAGPDVDHGLHISVTLAVGSTEHSVRLGECNGDNFATVEPIVKELETLAERATADDRRTDR